MQLTDQQKENVKLWLAALRSGEYDQQQAVLKNGFGYCCLGVACDVYRKQTGKGNWIDTTDSRGGFTFDTGDVYNNVEIIDSPAIREHFGFDDVSGFNIPPFFLPSENGDEGTGTTLPIRLTEVNDELELTFPQIADLIEKYILNGEKPMTTEQIQQHRIDGGMEF